MMKFAACIFCTVVWLICGSGCDDDVQPRQSVTIFTAASTADAVAQVTGAMPGEGGAVISAGASSTLATQIIHGAPVDLFLSANSDWADEVAKQRVVLARVDLLSNRLVVIVPLGSPLTIFTAASLAQPGLKRLALGDTASVPAGIYAKRALEAWDVWEQVEPRVLTGSDAMHVLMLVETGSADAGVVYATDAAASTKVRIALEVPAELAGPIVYPLLLLSDREPARRMFDWLQSPQAAAIFEHHGFAVTAAPR